MARRKVVKIDEEKCNGCGLCVPSCAEGALEIVNGKARIVADVYCDGLGACLGECPQGAISVEEREAPEFDAAAAEAHVRRVVAPARDSEPLPCGCPGMAVKSIERSVAAPERIRGEGEAPTSRLRNWPVQLKLVPVQAPYLKGARLLIAADCVPFAFADFHRRFVEGRVVLMGCPKLDDGQFYVDKLAQIFGANDIESVLVPHMEVPCCTGLIHIVEAAQRQAGTKVPTTLVRIGIDGSLQEERRA